MRLKTNPAEYSKLVQDTANQLGVDVNTAKNLIDQKITNAIEIGPRGINYEAYIPSSVDDGVHYFTNKSLGNNYKNIWGLSIPIIGVKSLYETQD